MNLFSLRIRRNHYTEQQQQKKNFNLYHLQISTFTTKKHQMIKKSSLMSNPVLSHTQSFKSPLEDLNGTQRFAKSPTYSRNSNFKPSVIDKQHQKIEKRNIELLKLFKPTQKKQFNMSLLQNSPLMQTNEVFNYLVNKLKKQRHGMIDVVIQEQKRKSLKPIENKIRQFVYHSLHEALLMPQSELKQTRYLERLFNWFTQVFRQRQMKLGFKFEKNDDKNDDKMDDDWMIRNTYKSNLPLEIGQFQRKLLNVEQLSQLRKNHQNSDKNRTFDFDNRQFSQSMNQKDIHENNSQKLYTLPSVNTPSYSKSTELLPVLNARAYMSKLIRNREEKQNDQLKAFEQEWRKSKARFFQHSTKKYLQSQNTRGKTLQKTFQDRQNRKKNKQNNRPLSLGTKVLQKIQAARLGVTCTQFRKNKQSILRQNPTQTYNSPVFHPYLTSNYFHDIKKKRLQRIQKNSFPHLLKNQQKRNTEESEEIDKSNQEINQRDFEDQKYCEMLFAEKPDEDQLLESVDGLGLSIIIGQKKEKGKKKYKK